jgi:hypothetical protein
MGAYAHALLFAKDARGAVTPLWDSGARRATGETLRVPFEVTPGSVDLVAVFSDVPLDATPSLSPIPGEKLRAQVRLEVEDP